MNSGLLRGTDPSPRGHTAGNQFFGLNGRTVASGGDVPHRVTKEGLIWFPVPNFAVINLSSIGADIMPDAGETSDISRLQAQPGPGVSNCIPGDGSLVGVSLQLHTHNSTVAAGTCGFIYDWDSPNPLVGNSGAVYIAETMRKHSGAVAAHYASIAIPFVRTGGLNNAQLRYAFDWGSGTSIMGAYCTGYWVKDR